MFTEWLFVTGNFNFFKYLFRVFLLLGSLTLFGLALIRIIRFSKNETTKNILLLVGGLFFVFILLEISFSFISVSSGGADTLVSKNWFNYHWKENRLGYRDLDTEEIDRADKKNILIIGDSYVAGHGLNKESEMFSNILRNDLKNNFDIFNLGICGADTKAEFGFLSKYPVKPDMIIVSHVNNDIYTVLEKREIISLLNLDKQFKSQIKRFKNSKSFIVSHSFLLNFLDFIIISKRRELYLKSLSEKYSTFDFFLDSEDAKGIEMCYYKNDSLLNLHLREIDKFISYSKEANIPLLFILFPKMNDEVIDFTDRTANKPIAMYLNKNHIAVVNLTSQLKFIPEKRRMVSAFDPHPSPYSNIIIAKAIQKHLKSISL